MRKRIGIIGVGHLGHYLLTGFSRADCTLEFFLADPSIKTYTPPLSDHTYELTTRNQRVADKADIIILATRPEHAEEALKDLQFQPDQIVVSVAAGVSLDTLSPLVLPAKAVRALPISCVAINVSPVLIYPDDKKVTELFSMVGQVHLLPNENTFTPGTSLVGAFYAWLFLLMDEAATWTSSHGINPDMARKLVVETMKGASCMAEEQGHMDLGEIWKTLATPGGISEYGARILSGKKSMKDWSDALEAVTNKMKP
jgi:pyrroline-5-carboxylate reductase